MIGKDFGPDGRRIAFWTAMVIGAALRIYCVGFTNGTGDMDDWEDHAQQVHDRGLIGYYHANSFENHPPFISEAASLMLQISTAVRVPFRIPFRGLFVLFDVGNALLLFRLLPAGRSRSLATAIYWLSPAAIIISAYHGNTDTAIAFVLLLSMWVATRMRTPWSGVAFGAGLWIKVPTILAFPAFMIWFRTWRSRGIFTLAAAATALSTYLPALIQDYQIVLKNVFGYRGLVLQTATGVPLWGPSVLLFSTFAPIQVWPEKLLHVTLFVLEQSWDIAIAAMLVLMWLRRERRAPEEVCATIAMGYVILLGFSDNWAFQYFAWSLPFWFFLRWRFSIPAISLTSAYLYALHSFFSGSALLLGNWDFGAHPILPFPILCLRDLAVAFFVVSACTFLIAAIRRQSPSTASST
ncbi:MAG TPA: glycosyltransferase 87 family protein [Chthoniobacterales bacterium]|nr:glycosyltransferase 87 family protein [Chthoniobacterales bacterium]